MTTYISINSHIIRKNVKDGENAPPIRIAKSKHDKSPIYAHEVSIDGPSKLLYDPDKKILNCGARLVLETEYVVKGKNRNGK